MQIGIRDNFPEVRRKLTALQTQGRFAMAVAMTRTMQDVRKAEQAEMRRVLDRPTPFTLNSLYVQTATKQRLEGRVGIKESDRPTHYLLPSIYGGSRPQKRYEELLRQAGVLSAGERTVPGAGAKLDVYGNMVRGQITQILSQLRAFNSAGFDANATTSRRSRAKRLLGRYFVARQGESRGGLKSQHLRSGIYFASPTGIVPVLIFVGGTRYSRRFDFYRVAKSTIHFRFEQNFSVEYAKALATARLKR